MTPTPDDLLRFGPLLLFAMAVAETAVPAGLVVPAGVALATGSFLAHQGLLAWELVIPASAAGALVGDSIGFWLGRTGSPLLERTPGGVGRLARGARKRAAVLFDRHALAAVTGARLVAFVRTLMPPTAGSSGMSYPRFLAFDAPGVLGWTALYVILGLGAGEGWTAWSAGAKSGAAFLLLLVLLVVGFTVWRIRKVRRVAAADRAASNRAASDRPGGGAP